MLVLSLRTLCCGAALLLSAPVPSLSQNLMRHAGAGIAATTPLPSAAERNVWYRYKDSNTVVVFVHGIFSNIRDCWHYKDARNPARSAYWPEMITRDPAFGDAAIFLAGYHTSLTSRAYDIPQSAYDVRDALTRRTPGGQRVLDKANIIFVAHSTGGIVVRHLLYHNQDLFRGKNIGLVLMASPSRGSYYANYLRLLSSVFGNDMARQLQVNNPYLDQLDGNFRDLLQEQGTRGLNIKGIERCENHMILVRNFWPDGRLVVDPKSCAPYFGNPRILPGTDHFGTVKPNSPTHPGYLALLDFYTKFHAQAAAAEPRLDLDVRISPRVEIARDTVQDVRRLLLSPTSCTADTTVTDRYTVPPRWKIRTVGNPIIPTSQGQRLLVEGVQVEADSAVQVKLKLLASGDSSCPAVPDTYEYALQISAERLETRVLEESAVPSVQLTPTQPVQRLTYSRGLADRRIRSRQWLYRAYVRGRTRTTQVQVDLSNARPEVAGIRTDINDGGELTIDARSAFNP